MIFQINFGVNWPHILRIEDKLTAELSRFSQGALSLRNLKISVTDVEIEDLAGVFLADVLSWSRFAEIWNLPVILEHIVHFFVSFFWLFLDYVFENLYKLTYCPRFKAKFIQYILLISEERFRGWILYFWTDFARNCYSKPMYIFLGRQIIRKKRNHRPFQG